MNKWAMPVTYRPIWSKDVRKAAWQSLLAGGAAGITYGAHGIWSWQTPTATFAEEIGEAFDRPMIWPEALSFPGADDYGFIKQLFELLNIQELVPCQERLIDADEQIRMAAIAGSKDALLYLPSYNSSPARRSFYSDRHIDRFEYQSFLETKTDSYRWYHCFPSPQLS